MDRVTYSFSIEYDDQEYEVEMSANCAQENYGADADGNRGLQTVWIEDIRIVSIDHDVRKLPLEAQKEIEAQAFKEAEDFDWWRIAR